MSIEPSSVIPATASLQLASTVDLDAVPADSLLLVILLNGKSFAEIDYQIEFATRECMQEAGWDYVVGEPPPSGPETFRSFADRTLDIGYSITLNDRDIIYDANLEYQFSLDSDDRNRYLRDLIGGEVEGSDNPAPGCLARSQTDVTADVPYYVAPFGQLNQDFIYEFESDPRWQEAMRDWSACVSNAGFQFTSPAHAREAVLARWADAADHESSTTQDELALIIHGAGGAEVGHPRECPPDLLFLVLETSRDAVRGGHSRGEQ